MDGTATYNQATKAGYDYYIYYSNTGGFPNYARISGNTVIFNRFKGGNNVAGTANVFSQGNNICCFRYNTGDSQNTFYITSSIDNVNDFTADLSNNNAIGYYVLAAPEYIQITDSTLINQLEAVKDYLFDYYLDEQFLLDYSDPEVIIK